MERTSLERVECNAPAERGGTPAGFALANYLNKRIRTVFLRSRVDARKSLIAF
jgi:hypothetical protein